MLACPLALTAPRRRRLRACRRRNFYIEVPELARMSKEEVEEYRAELDGIKVRGKNVPKPIKNWHQVQACLPACLLRSFSSALDSWDALQ